MLRLKRTARIATCLLVLILSLNLVAVGAPPPMISNPDMSGDMEVRRQRYSQPTPEPTTEPEPYIEPEPTTEPELYIEPETTTDPELYIEPEPTTEPEPYIEPEPTTEPEPYVEPEPHTDPEPYIESAGGIAPGPSFLDYSLIESASALENYPAPVQEFPVEPLYLPTPTPTPLPMLPPTSKATPEIPNINSNNELQLKSQTTSKATDDKDMKLIRLYGRNNGMDSIDAILTVNSAAEKLNPEVLISATTNSNLNITEENIGRSIHGVYTTKVKLKDLRNVTSFASQSLYEAAIPADFPNNTYYVYAMLKSDGKTSDIMQCVVKVEKRS